MGPAAPLGNTEPGGRAAVLRDAFFALVAGVVLVWELRDPYTHPVGVTAVVVMIAMYVAFGRPLMRLNRTQRRGTLLGLILVVLYAVALAGSLTAIYLLCALCPVLFAIQPLRPAATMAATVNVLPVAVAVTQQGIAAPVVAILAPIAAVAVPTSIWLGYWINRVSRLSHERAELITALEHSRAEVARLSHEAGTTAERTRLAGEIHDTLAQGFTSIITLLQAARLSLPPEAAATGERVDLAVRTARENLAEARAMVTALTPAALHDGDLVAALRRQAGALTEHTALTATVRTSGTLRALPTAVEVVLLRAAQEALTNVRRHAAADEVTLLLAYTPETIQLMVRDNGRGLDLTHTTLGYGLRGMQARAEQVNGTFAIHSNANSGTTIELEIPA